jgi:hypothetical protein
VDIALLMCMCEGEEAIAWDVLSGIAQSCNQARLSLFIVDDGSPSRVGDRIAARFRQTYAQPATCHRLPKSLRFYGMAERLFIGLNDIAASGTSFDLVLKLDPDICVVRRDFLEFLKQVSPNGVGLFGERYTMRARDSLLLVADLVPAGFARKRVQGVMHREWRLRRLFPVWWSDFGRRALINGFRFGFIAGGFWILGGRSLRKLAETNWLGRDQSKHGFVFTDDVLLTLAMYALGEPVVDLATVSPHWGRFLSITEETPLDAIVPHRPYIVHHLKDRPKGWERRRALKAAFGWTGEQAAAETQNSS